MKKTVIATTLILFGVCSRGSASPFEEAINQDQEGKNSFIVPSMQNIQGDLGVPDDNEGVLEEQERGSRPQESDARGHEAVLQFQATQIDMLKEQLTKNHNPALEDYLKELKEQYESLASQFSKNKEEEEQRKLQKIAQIIDFPYKSNTQLDLDDLESYIIEKCTGPYKDVARRLDLPYIQNVTDSKDILDEVKQKCTKPLNEIASRLGIKNDGTYENLLAHIKSACSSPISEIAGQLNYFGFEEETDYKKIVQEIEYSLSSTPLHFAHKLGISGFFSKQSIADPDEDRLSVQDLLDRLRELKDAEDF